MKRKTDFENVIKSEDVTASVVTSPTLPVLDSIKGLTDLQKRELTDVLTASGYDKPVLTLARLGSRAFTVLNGIYKNIVGPCSVGGDKGFPLLVAYQKECEYAKKLEADQTVCSKKGKGEVKQTN